MTLLSAHLAGLLEPLLFLPAFLAVLWSVFTTIRRRGSTHHHREDDR